MKTLTIRLGSIIVFAGLLGACSDDTTTKADAAVNDSTAAEASVGKKDGAGDVTIVPDQGGADLAQASCPALITWTTNGGMVAYRDTQKLVTCTDFTLTRQLMGSGAKSESCQTTISASDADLLGVLAALGRTDVKGAFGGTVKFYGRDSRPVDGVAFSVTIDGKTLLIGGACNAKLKCVAIPAGLAALRTHLQAITAAQRKLPACSNITP